MQCKQCGANRGSQLWQQNQTSNDTWYEFKQRAFVGNYEGTIVDQDAGIFCSLHCLGQYMSLLGE